MDREQILEDLKQWLRNIIAFGDEVDPQDVLDEIEYLEEEYE